MSRFRLCLVGFGTVGQGLAEILAERGPELAQRHGLDVRITAVTDLMKGTVVDPEGLDPAALLEAVRARGSLAGAPGEHPDWDAVTTIREASADVVAELAYTDLASGEPALTHVTAALEAGRHVITTNKGPIALRYPQLRELAARQGVGIGAEGTVMSGTPALGLGVELLAGSGITRIEGILNGTTNYILTRMEAGLDFEAALAEAQEKGYAEADPSGDVDGIDAAGKVVILANLVMGESLTMDDVERQGLRGVTLDDVETARAAGERWKLIGSVARVDGRVRAAVGPKRIAGDHPLAAIGGATNAVTYSTDLLGDVSLVGPGAGKAATGYALIGDLLALHRRAGGERP